MTKYHIKDNGETGRCEASVGKCKYGENTPHFNSPEEARFAFESSMKDKNFAKLSNANLPLSTLFSMDEFDAMVREGYVDVRSHPDNDDLLILNYSTQTQYAGKWNDVTKQARGLIVEKQGDGLVVVERPWRKFFTLGQIKNPDGSAGWALGDDEEGTAKFNELSLLDFDAPAEVTDKSDGSMGVLYRAPNGELQLSTRGSFASEQALMYSQFLQENKKFRNAGEELREEHPNTTFIFELVGPENRIVVNYDKPDIVLLGAVDKKTGLYRSVDDFQNIWSREKGLTTTQKFEAQSISEALKIPDRKNAEGVVVRLKSDDPDKQMQVKIKQEDYLKLHHLAYSFGRSSVRKSFDNAKVSFDELVELDKSGDYENLGFVKDSLSSFDGSDPFIADLKKKNVDMFRESMSGELKTMMDSYRYVESLPEAMFAGDPKEAKANFAKGLVNDKNVSKDYVFKFFDNKINGVDNQNVALMFLRKAKKTQQVQQHTS